MAMINPTRPAGGAYAEYVVLPERSVVPAPVNTTHAQAATLPANGLTARLALDQLALRPLTMTTISVGIIGASPGSTSWAANTHVPALRALPDFELKAVSTSRRESALAAASAYGVPAYDNAADLIAHPGIDLVVVAVKVPHHHELISAALAAGKMVYSEWPLGTDLAQATDLAARAEAAGMRTVIGLQGSLRAGDPARP